MLALITGISGQDGSYLAEQLLADGWEVHGITRSRTGKLGCSSHLAGRIRVHSLGTVGDTDRLNGLRGILEQLQPDELYHFAADSFVPNGWENPLANLQSNTGFTIQILEAIRQCCPEIRMVNACSREVFGSWFDGFASEETEMRPATPYGINKAASRWMVNAYRDRYGLFVTNAILFNHESPRRGGEFVTRKVAIKAAEIALGLSSKVTLGNLQARRDWGFAGDFVDAMRRMLKLREPEEFVIGTGTTHSIQQLVEKAFSFVGLDWREHVTTRPQLARLNDGFSLAADITKARKWLNWSPTTNFDCLVEMMVQSELDSFRLQQRRKQRA